MVPFVVAADDDWLVSLGVLPLTEEASGDDYVRELRLPINDAEELHLTWDETDQSVRVRLRRGPEVIVDLYREQATLLTTEADGPRRYVVLEYRAGGYAGRTRVQVRPAFAMQDSLLRA
jgi:hypothetical protein